jgi:hypothetical protein
MRLGKAITRKDHHTAMHGKELNCSLAIAGPRIGLRPACRPLARSVRSILGIVGVALALPAAGLAQSLSAAEPATDADVTAARQILDGWQGEASEPGERLLHVIAWRTNDREFPADQQARLDRIMTHIEDFYRREMERHGFGPRSIRLDRDADGKLVVHEVVGEGAWADYDGPDGARIRKECVPAMRAKGIDIDRETVMIFTNLAEWDPEKRTFRHKSPYYAGGDWRRGTAWQLDSPELDTRNLAAKQPLVQDGQYGRISLGKHNSIFIGGIAHELGHALGLPHCRERPDEAARGTALMGSGNRTYGDEERGEGKGSFLTLAHALRLASHPQFSGSIKGLGVAAKGTFAELAAATTADGKAFRLTGRVTGEPPIYAVVGYLDPEGGSDYDARTVSATPDADGRFTLDCTAVVPGRAAQVRLVALHANGATTSTAQPYAVATDGTVEVETMQVTLALTTFLDLLAKQGPEAARGVAPADGPAARFAAAVLAGRCGDRATTDPAEPADELKTLPLSQARPAEAKVGWLRPAYDHLPRQESLIESAGRLYETGIYAHAPAAHRYELAGRWKRLRGDCGLPTQRGGTVVFVIKTDGREVFRSARLTPGKTATYDLDLAGVESLELVTEDGGDGNGADWGVWLAPELSRP